MALSSDSDLVALSLAGHRHWGMFAEETSGRAPYWGLEIYVITAYVKTTFPTLGQISGSCVIDPDSVPRENSTAFTTVPSAIFP